MTAQDTSISEFAKSLTKDEIPAKLRCSSCNKLAVNAVKLACCDQSICEDCQSSLSSSCPICMHSPLDATSCNPNKSLRLTIKAFLRAEEKKRGRSAAQKLAPTTPLTNAIVAGDQLAETAAPEQAETATTKEASPQVLAEVVVEALQSADATIGQDETIAPQAVVEEVTDDKDAEGKDVQEASEDSTVVVTSTTDEGGDTDTADLITASASTAASGNVTASFNMGINPMMAMPNGSFGSFPNMMGMGMGMGMGLPNMFGGMNGMNAMGMADMSSMSIGMMGMMNGFGGGWNQAGMNGNFYGGGGGDGSGGAGYDQLGFGNQMMNHQFPNQNYSNNRFRGQGAYRGYGRGRGGFHGRGNFNQQGQQWNRNGPENRMTQSQTYESHRETVGNGDVEGPNEDTGGYAASGLPSDQAADQAVDIGMDNAFEVGGATNHNSDQAGGLHAHHDSVEGANPAEGTTDVDSASNTVEQNDAPTIQVGGNFHRANGVSSTAAPPVNAPTGPKAMRQGFVNWQSRGYGSAPERVAQDQHQSRRESAIDHDSRNSTSDRRRSISRGLQHRHQSRSRSNSSDGHGHASRSRRRDDEVKEDLSGRGNYVGTGRRSRSRSSDAVEERSDRETSRRRHKRDRSHDRPEHRRGESRSRDRHRGSSGDRSKEHRGDRARSRDRKRDRSRDRHRSSRDDDEPARGSRRHRHRSRSRHRDSHGSRSHRRDSRKDRDHRTDREQHDRDRHRKRDSSRSPDLGMVPPSSIRPNDDGRKSRRPPETPEDDLSKSIEAFRRKRSQVERKEKTTELSAASTEEIGFKIKGSREAARLAVTDREATSAPPSGPKAERRRAREEHGTDQVSEAADPYAVEREARQKERMLREQKRRESATTGDKRNRERDALDPPSGPRADNKRRGSGHEGGSQKRHRSSYHQDDDR